MPDEVKTEEKVMSPSAFSKFELHVESDGNVLDIPINFGMTDDEVRKIYPYLLSVSRMEDNPMINFARLQESGEINKYTPEQQQKYEIWASRMSKYWYGKPSASLLDVAIGLAIDMKFHGTRLGDIEDIPDNEYEALMQNPANADPAAISDAELSALERKYGIHPDSDASITLVGEDKHNVIAGGLDVDMYGDEKVDDFLSAELDEISTKLDYKDKFAEIIEKDYNENIAADRYKSEYSRGGLLSESDINKDSGLLTLYNDTDIFARIDAPADDDDEYDGDEFDEYEDSEDEDELDDSNDVDLWSVSDSDSE